MSAAPPGRGPGAPVLEARALSVGYRHRRRRLPVLQGVDQSVRAGELVCLLGPNGVGKSTLLRTLAGMQAPLAGEVRLGGDALDHLDARERARRVSVVLTDRVDPGLLTARDVVALGRTPRTGWTGRLSPTDHAAVDAALEAVGVAHLSGRVVGELSDGERQRVMVARALAQEPLAVLLDEPTAFLDVAARVELTGTLRRLCDDRGVAALCSTHDLDLALQWADTVWLVTPDGRVHAGAPEDVLWQELLPAAFPGSTWSFDGLSGGIVPHREPVGTARVVGSGRARVLTERALERCGLLVTDDAGPDALVVEAADDDGRLALAVRSGGGLVRLGSVAELVRLARRRSASATAARPDEPAGGERVP